MRSKRVKGAMRGESVSTSARILRASDKRSRVKWEARSGGASSSADIEVAVVSQRPGTCGDIADGRTEIEVAIGIWRDRDRPGVRKTWAMRDAETLLYRVARALARLD